MLVRALARKCRELAGIYDYGLDGPFAQHFQKLLNAHRGAFCDPHALQGKEGGLKRCYCHVIAITDREDETCEVDLGAGETREVSLSQLEVPAIMHDTAPSRFKSHHTNAPPAQMPCCAL